VWNRKCKSRIAGLGQREIEEHLTSSGARCGKQNEWWFSKGESRISDLGQRDIAENGFRVTLSIESEMFRFANEIPGFLI